MTQRFAYVQLALAFLSLTALSGCQALSRSRRVPPTQSDRLMQAYPELSSGRFLVIADFEDAVQLELFQLENASAKAKYGLDNKRGRAETGKGCLSFTAGSPDDTIVVSNAAAANWYLKRDWRPYDLLLMSVHAPKPIRRSPRRNLALRVVIAGGVGDELSAIQSAIPLQQGWNVLRLDLAEIGERVPLDDVREMRLSLTGSEKPTVVRLDDILLTAHREDLLGDSSDTTGGLYAQRMGRRWKIGSGGGFEVVFANGQIVEWYNLAADPYRLRNLVEGTVLGPSPMVLGSQEEQQAGFSGLGSAVVVRERILELSSVRAVVACDWWFVDDPDLPFDDRPFQKWVYTIYPSGQMYVAVTCTAKTEQWSPQLGLAVTVASAPEDERRVHQGGIPDASAATAAPPPYATVRAPKADAFLLYTLSQPDDAAAIQEVADAQRRRVSLVAAGPPTDQDIQSWSCQVFLGQSGKTSDQEAQARAVDYTVAGSLDIQLGAPVAADAWHSAIPGFNPATGCYAIAPDHNDIRFIVGTPQRPVFSPAFMVLDSSGKDAWVYVNDLIFSDVARDRGGNLIFQLPGTVSEPIMVEVLLQPETRNDGA